MKKSVVRGSVVLLGAIAVAALAWLVLQPAAQSANPRSKPPETSATNPPPAPVAAAIPKAAVETNAPSVSELQRRAVTFADFQPHPFSAVKENNLFGWTGKDGKNPDVIRKLAHNELEFERLAEENDRIYSRELVYHKDTVDAQVQRAKLAEQPIQQLVLPGLDGHEVQIEITATDLSPSGQRGTFSGQVAGQPDSMVTVAFKGGREAFTILSPADNLYLVAEPREPGELIVKKIDPETYTGGANCGNQ